MPAVPVIFEHEMNALLDALRRDLRTEQKMVYWDSENSFLHENNIRYVKRLLDLLNPRGPDRFTSTQHEETGPM